MCPSLIYSPFPVPFNFPLGGTWSKTAPLSPDFSGKELIVQPVSQMWCDLAPLMKVSNVLQFPVPKLGYNPTALSESIMWTFWKAFLCIVSILWPPFIWIHCSLHYRGAWHPDLNTPQVSAILPSGYDSQHYQECVLWLFQHLRVHSAFVTRVRFHGNACRCHWGMPVTMETDG